MVVYLTFVRRRESCEEEGGEVDGDMEMSTETSTVNKNCFYSRDESQDLNHC